jgi:hypothetical protein
MHCPTNRDSRCPITALEDDVEQPPPGRHSRETFTFSVDRFPVDLLRAQPARAYLDLCSQAVKYSPVPPYHSL